MRVQIHVDSANTPQVRELLAAVASIGKAGEAKVGLNGPECWTATTPHLTPDEFARVTGRLVKHKGVRIGELVSSLQGPVE